MCIRDRSIPGLGGAFTTKSISGGGVLIDWGVHYIDIAMYCLGDPEPKAVSGKAYCALGKDIEGYTYVNMWAGPPVLDLSLIHIYRGNERSLPHICRCA